jgi:(4-O-methyl)-D-glucuronate---lignin esterase
MPPEVTVTHEGRSVWFALLCNASVVMSVLIPCVMAQTTSPANSVSPPVAFTAEQDQQNMMEQLGIRALRPGPSGNESAPNHANYDEAKANPFPNIPDALRLNDGQKVTTPALWQKRRAEITEGFDCCVYGRVPNSVPKVTWSVAAVDHERIGFTPVIAKQVIGRVDNSAYPLIDVNIRMILVTPADASKPVPVLMMFAPARFPEPNQPSEEQLERINSALESILVQQDPSLKQVFEQHPAYQLEMPKPFSFPQLNADGDPPNTWELISDGWGFALIDPASIQADNGSGLTRGIIGLVNHGLPRRPDDWGALRAWAWGAGCGLDYLETDPSVDAKHVGIEGVSRYGKAALVTMAFDQRFAAVLVGSSGKGGATLLRRNFGEAVESLTGGEYYWMAGNFMKYGAADAVFGSMDASDIPVDSNELIALCAPRLTFVSYGIPEKGDAKWLDHRGSFMATLDASPVWALLGAQGLAPRDGYSAEKMPPVNTGLLEGKLAWRQDDGGHTDAPNMKYFLGWVDRFVGRPSVFSSFAR